MIMLLILFFDTEFYVPYIMNYTQVYHVAHIIVYNYIIINRCVYNIFIYKNCNLDVDLIVVMLINNCSSQ